MRQMRGENEKQSKEKKKHKKGEVHVQDSASRLYKYKSYHRVMMMMMAMMAMMMKWWTALPGRGSDDHQRPRHERVQTRGVGSTRGERESV